MFYITIISTQVPWPPITGLASLLAIIQINESFYFIIILNCQIRIGTLYFKISR